jgi:glycogen operon protein
MLLAGDEMGRTQGGNNNAYCQDNDVSWLDWSLATKEQDLLRFTEQLTALRRDHPVFRRRRFFRGHPQSTVDTDGDIVWLTPAGEEMTQSDWDAGYAKSLGVYLNGDAITEPDPRGNPVHDDRFLLLFNAGGEPITFTLPPAEFATTWKVIIDTTHTTAASIEVRPRSEVKVASHAVTVLRSAG